MSIDNTKHITNKGTDSTTETAVWNLQIKSVGEQHANLSLQLSPYCTVADLCVEIGQHTGLAEQEQRLIYRGRLLDKNQSLHDIHGLKNGHTIHLVRRPPPSATTLAPPQANVASSSSSLPTNNNNNNDASNSNTSSGLLASLIGGLSNTSEDEPPPRRSRRFRYTADDLIRPDPGSLEAVRQNLLTLHSMQNHRQFYVGQWVDCRDTVNQWLEATIVQIVSVEAILHRPPLCGNSIEPTTDPVVTHTDLEGRRKLLLELCDAEQSEEQIAGLHYKQRSNNGSVQILHIHYNGWPTRWDEWIRSDSERLRHFRVRTRHANSTTALVSPTIQSTMPNPPNTLLGHSEEHDRQLLLPELSRVMGTVHTMLQESASQMASVERRATDSGPWLTQQQQQAAINNNHNMAPRSVQQQQLETLAPFLDRLGRALTDAAPHVAALATSLEEEQQQEQQHDDDDDSVEEDEEHPSTLGGLLSLLSGDRARRGQSVSSSAAVPSVNLSVASSTVNEQTTVAEEEEEEEEAVAVDPDLVDYGTGFVNTTRGEVRSGPRGRGGGGASNEDVASFLGAYLAAASLSVGTVGEGEAGGLGRLLRDRGSGGIDIHIHAVVTTPGLDGGIGLATVGGNGGVAAALPTTTNTNGNNGGLGSLFASREDTSRRNSRRAHRPQPQIVSPTRTAAPPVEDEQGIFAELYSENPDPVNRNSPTAAQPVARALSPARVPPTRGPSRRSPVRGSGSRRNGVLGRLFRRTNSENQNDG